MNEGEDQGSITPTLPVPAAYSFRSSFTVSKMALICSSLTVWSMLMQQTPVSQGLSDCRTSRVTVSRISAGRLADDAHRVEPEVEERVRQMPAQQGHVAAPAEVEEIQPRQLGVGRREAMRVLAAMMDAERPVPPAPFRVNRHAETPRSPAPKSSCANIPSAGTPARGNAARCG